MVIGGGGSDFFDGWVARKWNVASWQGGLLDAVADKAFILIAFTTFASAGKFSPWWIPAVIARDLLVVVAATYAVYCSSWSSFREMDSRWSGKYATAGQFLLLITVTLFPAYLFIILYLTVLASVVAALDYGAIFIKALRDK